MLELYNQSNWPAGLFRGWSLQHEAQLTAVFKVGYKFELDGSLTPLKKIPPLIQTDEHFGSTTTSSLKAATEIAPFKQGGEVYLFGTAYPHGPGQSVTEVGMGIAFPDGRSFKKILRVFGRREWKRVLLNYVMGQSADLEPTPLIYEYAYGGRSSLDPDDGYPLNPVGLGFNGNSWRVPNIELPRIEQAPHFVTSPSQQPPPAGYGPLPVFWQPRATERGRPEAHGGCPNGDSVGPSLHNVAPVDQRFKKPFKGGEVIHLAGFFKTLSMKEVVRLKLPQLNPQLYTSIDNQATLLRPVCDTLIINTDQRQVHLIYRAAISWQLSDRRNGWVVLKDLENPDHTANRDSKDALGTAHVRKK